MTNKEFAKGLMKLADRHVNDHVSVFDTNWFEVCNEAAKIILDLDQKIIDLEEDIKTWEKWMEQTSEYKISKELSVPPFMNPEELKSEFAENIIKNLYQDPEDYEDDTKIYIPHMYDPNNIDEEEE